MQISFYKYQPNCGIFNMAAIFQHGRRGIHQNTTFDLKDGSRRY